MIHHHRYSESETHQLRGECFSDIETLHVRRRTQDAPAHHHHLLRRHHIVFCSLPEPSHALGQEEGAHAPARSDSARASSRIDIDPRQPLASQALEARDKTGRSRSDSLLLCAQDRGSRTCLRQHMLVGCAVRENGRRAGFGMEVDIHAAKAETHGVTVRPQFSSLCAGLARCATVSVFNRYLSSHRPIDMVVLAHRCRRSWLNAIKSQERASGNADATVSLHLPCSCLIRTRS